MIWECNVRPAVGFTMQEMEQWITVDANINILRVNKLNTHTYLIETLIVRFRVTYVRIRDCESQIKYEYFILLFRKEESKKCVEIRSG